MDSQPEAEKKEGRAEAGAAAGVTGPPAQCGSGSQSRPEGPAWAAKYLGQLGREGP